jgi:hypothetical protein
MHKVIWVTDAKLGCVINDHTIYAALHGTYQMVIHQVAIDCLVGDQDVHLASDWVIVCNGTHDNREFYGAKHSGKA